MLQSIGSKRDMTELLNNKKHQQLKADNTIQASHNFQVKKKKKRKQPSLRK